MKNLLCGLLSAFCAAQAPSASSSVDVSNMSDILAFLAMYADAPANEAWFIAQCDPKGGILYGVKALGTSTLPGPLLDLSKFHFDPAVTSEERAFTARFVNAARICKETGKGCDQDIPFPCAGKCEGDACKPIS